MKIDKQINNSIEIAKKEGKQKKDNKKINSFWGEKAKKPRRGTKLSQDYRKKKKQS